MENNRYKLYIYDDYKVDLYNYGILDKSITNDFELEKLLNQQDKENQKLKQSQKQLAISELKKVKNILRYYCDVKSFGCDIFNYLDNQIKELKGVNYESNK